MLRTRQLAPHLRAVGLALAAATTWILAPSEAAAQTEDVIFRAAVGVTVSGNDLNEDRRRGWGNAGAVSVQTIESNGFVEFSANGSAMLGLSKGDTDQDLPGHRLRDLSSTPAVSQVYEAGTHKGHRRYRSRRRTSSAWKSREASFATGRTASSSTPACSPPRFPLLVDAALNTTGPTLIDARIGQTSYLRGRRRHGLGGHAHQDRRGRLERGCRLLAEDPLGRRLRRVHGHRDEQAARRRPVERRHRQDRRRHRLRDRPEGGRDGRGAGRRRLARRRRLLRRRATASASSSRRVS